MSILQYNQIEIKRLNANIDRIWSALKAIMPFLSALFFYAAIFVIFHMKRKKNIKRQKNIIGNSIKEMDIHPMR